MKSGTPLLLMAILVAADAVRADYDHDEIKRLRDTGQILPLETVIKNYRQQHQSGRILEAELEFQEGRYVYALEILQEDGTVDELEYDAYTGELWQSEDKSNEDKSNEDKN